MRLSRLRPVQPRSAIPFHLFAVDLAGSNHPFGRVVFDDGPISLLFGTNVNPGREDKFKDLLFERINSDGPVEQSFWQGLIGKIDRNSLEAPSLTSGKIP